MTPHTRIPLNQGICGAAASTGKTIVVDDVNLDNRYLACSTETKSEIVVPVFVRGKVVGELDIDSHFPAAFGDEDRDLVEYCASLVGKQLEKLRRMKSGKDQARASGGSRASDSREALTSGDLVPSLKQVVAALIFKDERILVCQRTRHQTMPLKWEFPGGKIEAGEQPRDALRRELNEELGIDATIGDEVARIRHEYKSRIGGGIALLRRARVQGRNRKPNLQGHALGHALRPAVV